jgi:hypothetical protein
VDGLNYRASVSKGVFTLPVNRCFISNTSVQLLAFNAATGRQSPVVTVSADTGTVNAGQLITPCNNPNPGSTVQYITYVLADVPYTLITPDNTIVYNTYGSSNVYIFGNGSFASCNIVINQLTAAGNYTNDSAYIVAPTGTYSGVVSCVVSAFGPIDSYIQGTFTGPVAPVGGGQTQTVSGSFYVQRTY